MQTELTHQLFLHERETKDVNRHDRHIGVLDERTDNYLVRLKEIDAKITATDADSRKLLSDIINLNDSILASCAAFEQSAECDAAAIREARIRFREKTHPLLSRSNFITHARTWPRGHQGDYQILESAYRNMSYSSGIGYLLDLYCLQTTLCVAVRERKSTLQQILRAELAARTEPRILDVACGSCRDVFEIAADIHAARARVNCVDFDSEALDFAADRMSYAKTESELVTFRKYNAFKMINLERNLKEFGPQDIIYSVGFFDYLKDDILARLLEALYQLLSPGGRLIASFKDCRNYRHHFYRWMVDWDGFFLRTEQDCWNLMAKAGIPPAALSFRRDRSGVIMFFIATR